MLKALAIASFASAALLVSGAANAVVINGDFEDVTTLDPTGLVKGNKLSNLATTGSSWDVFSEISGWKTTNGAGIEVQTNRTLGSIDAHSGQHYIELDSHPRANSNSTMIASGCNARSWKIRTVVLVQPTQQQCILERHRIFGQWLAFGHHHGTGRVAPDRSWNVDTDHGIVPCGDSRRLHAFL